MQVLSFCPDGPALAVITDRWRQAPSPLLLRDTTDHALRVSLASALRRSKASYGVVAHAAKLERQTRPLAAPRRRHAVHNQRIVRIYRAKLLESDVREIRRRWRRARKRTSKAQFIRIMQKALAATNLHVHAETIRQVIVGTTWQGA